MKTTESAATTAYSMPWRIFHLALLLIAGALIALLITGTIIGLARPKNALPLLTLPAPARTDAAFPQEPGDVRVFSGLGRLRVPLSNSSILILSIAFPYSAADTAFTEELAGKIGEFRAIATGYFASLPADKLANIDEEAAKQEILRRYNATLRLGRIEALYFSDMLTLE